MQNINVLGCESSVGSMLIPAKQMGCNILAMGDTRPIVKYGTCEGYFNLKMLYKLEELLVYKNKVDILFTQPSCANFSALKTLKNIRGEKSKQKNDLPIEVFEKIAKINPKFFIFENTPKILDRTNIMQVLANLMPSYKIKSYKLEGRHYGNLQKRQRAFIIGSKYKGFEYTPPLFALNAPTLGELVSGCEGLANHPDLATQRFFDRLEHKKCNYEEFQKAVKLNWQKRGYNQKMQYINSKGQLADCLYYPGMVIPFNQRKCRAITKIARLYYFENGDENKLPRELSIRQCARIMGFPDDFIFRGSSGMIQFKQVCSSVILQITRDITQQITAYILSHREVK